MPLRVLVVDDNAAFRAALGRLLGARGYAVVAESATGTDVAALVREHAPDLAIVDIQLPGTDGFAVAQQLAALDAGLPVILTSSLDAADLGTLVAESPARGFIAKADLSAAAIETLLRSSD